MGYKDIRAGFHGPPEGFQVGIEGHGHSPDRVLREPKKKS
ncbi:hypothetical protein MASR2M79_12060 [Aminivibrio sp.]